MYFCSQLTAPYHNCQPWHLSLERSTFQVLLCLSFNCGHAVWNRGLADKTLAGCLDFMPSMQSGGEALSAMCIPFCQKSDPRPENTCWCLEPTLKGIWWSICRVKRRRKFCLNLSFCAWTGARTGNYVVLNEREREALGNTVHEVCVTQQKFGGSIHILT